jgi:hypothetical protein
MPQLSRVGRQVVKACHDEEAHEAGVSWRCDKIGQCETPIIPACANPLERAFVSPLSQSPAAGR